MRFSYDADYRRRSLTDCFDISPFFIAQILNVLLRPILFSPFHHRQIEFLPTHILFPPHPLNHFVIEVHPHQESQKDKIDLEANFSGLAMLNL